MFSAFTMRLAWLSITLVLKEVSRHINDLLEYLGSRIASGHSWGTHPAEFRLDFGPWAPHREDGHGASVSPSHPLYVPLGGDPDADVRPPAPALATHTANYEVGYREIITVSLPYGQEIYCSPMEAAGILTVDIHAMSVADLLPDGSYVGRLLGRHA